MKHPNLLHENAGIRNSNWGPPLSYAANLGRDRIIMIAHELGVPTSSLTQSTVPRFKARSGTGGFCTRCWARPVHPLALDGTCLHPERVGTAFTMEIGAEVMDANGSGSLSRSCPRDGQSESIPKHQILRMYVEHGLELPILHDGAPSREHDLLEMHLRARSGTLVENLRP